MCMSLWQIEAGCVRTQKIGCEVLILQVLFPFISAEIHPVATALRACMCREMFVCVVPSFLHVYASEWLCDDCSAGGWGVMADELTGTSLWWSPSKRSTTATSTPINFSSYWLPWIHCWEERESEGGEEGSKERRVWCNAVFQSHIFCYFL